MYYQGSIDKKRISSYTKLDKFMDQIYFWFLSLLKMKQRIVRFLIAAVILYFFRFMMILLFGITG
jgi:hypothetical protein